MRRLTALFCLSLALSHQLEFATADDGLTALETPMWVWVSGPDHADGVRLANVFHLDSVPINAELRIAADFCDVALEVNGRRVLEMESFSPTRTLDITQHLVAGDNKVEVFASPVADTHELTEKAPNAQVGVADHSEMILDRGPSAIALSMTATAADGFQTRCVTDETWMAAVEIEGAATAFPVQELGRVSPEMWGVGARSIEISPFDDYEQWRRALGDDASSDSGRFWIREGFEIELVKAAEEDEGSWVALAFDDAGRLTVAREDRGLLRFVFDEPGGAVSQVETIEDELEECRGLAYVGNTLYANANNSHILFRLVDHDGDGDFDERNPIREFPGGVGHGRNCITVDRGALWMICGDSVEVPGDMFNHTSPFREASQGHHSSEGFLARFDLGSEEWQLYSAGLRNPFGVALNRDGAAFTYDADAEYDMGTPWYRPTRLLHLQSGADFGWRGVTGSWPPYDLDHPDNAQPLLDIGKGSPTAVDFGYDSNYPTAYREALYILDWAYGRVLAIHMTPCGGTYRAQAETFLQGSPLNVTGIDFGPDGAMYLVTGGRATKSALYRVRHVGESTTDPPETQHVHQLRQHAELSRRVRDDLQECRNDIASDELFAFIWHALGSRDHTIAHAAQLALEHQPLEFWRNRVLDSEPSRAQLMGLMALARSGDADLAQPILVRLLRYDFAALDVAGQLMWLHGISLCRELNADFDDAFRDQLLARTDQLFPDRSGVLRVSVYGTSVDAERDLARLLVELRAPAIVDRCMTELQLSTTQEDLLYYLFLLRDIADGWTEATHQAFFAALQDANSFVAGEGMPKFLDLIREAALGRLDQDTRARLDGVLESAIVDEPPAVINRPLVQDWQLEELVEAVAASEHEPSIERGREVFQQALCMRCHRVGARGPAVGPDLTYVGRRFAPEDILRSIVLPNHVVAENYRNLEVVTTDGRIITGRPVTAGDYRSPTLRIATNPLKPSETVELPKEDIEVSQLSDTSPMPADLLNTFTVEEVMDLLAYVASGGG